MRLLTLLMLGLILMAAGCATGGKPESDVSRVERIHQMENENSLRIAGEDAPGSTMQKTFGVHTFDKMWEGIKELYRMVTGSTARNAFDMMEDKNSADNRREGIYSLADRAYARTHPDHIYTKRWGQIAFGVVDGGRVLVKPDPDPLVRAAAIRALNRARAAEYGPQYLVVLNNSKDENEWVRLEAAKAIANMPDEKAASSLIKHMTDIDEQKDIRIACADALRAYKTPAAARALINSLQDRDFAVCWQARQSLALLTGHDYRYDKAAWLNFLTESEKPFG